MNIVCPQCGFSREVPPDRLPARSVIVTCPKCECRFRFSAAQGVLETLTPGRPVAPESEAAPEAADERASAQPRPVSGQAHDAPHEQECDDPLPPGAIVPGRSSASDDDEAQLESRPTEPTAAAGSARARQEAEDAAREKEELRRAAREAYVREAARPESEARRQYGDTEADAGGMPWDTAPAPDGWPAAFYQTVTRVMFAAPRFFVGLRPSRQQLRPLSFFLLVSMVQILVEYLWTNILYSMMAPAVVSDAQLERLAALLTPQFNVFMTLLLRGAEMTLKLYLFSALIHLTYRFLVPKKADFSLVFQIMAYGSAPALLCVVPFIGSLAGMIWSIAVILVGCRTVFNLSWQHTLMGFVPVVLVVAPVLLQLLNAGAAGGM